MLASLKADLKRVRDKGPARALAFSDQKRHNAAQKAILAASAMRLGEVHRRDVARCRERIEEMKAR